jgi:hypothetical protein
MEEEKVKPQMLDNPLDRNVYILNPQMIRGCHDIRFLYQSQGKNSGKVDIIMRYSKKGIHIGQGCKTNNTILSDRLELVPSNLEITLDGKNSLFQSFSDKDMPHPEGRIWQQTRITLDVGNVKQFEKDISSYFEKEPYVKPIRE